jgi:ribosomal protein S18 acetylase RimI-like enzyme
MEEPLLGRITGIGKRHDRKHFDSGNPTLDEWFVAYARQADRKGTTRVFVGEQAGQSNRVLGFYALSAGEIAIEDLPSTQRKQLPRYPVPVVRLTRLAVARSCQGRGLGGMLLVDALRRCVDVSTQLGTVAVVVDAIDKNAATFYERYGFINLTGKPLKLFLPIVTVRDL